MMIAMMVTEQGVFLIHVPPDVQRFHYYRASQEVSFLLSGEEIVLVRVSPPGEVLPIFEEQPNGVRRRKGLTWG